MIFDSELQELMAELDEKIEEARALKDSAQELREKANKLENQADVIEAEIKIAQKFSAFIKKRIEAESRRAEEDAENAIKTEDADFRSYTQKVCEFVADDEGFNRVTAEYRKSRRLPDGDDEDAPDEKADEELHRVA